MLKLIDRQCRWVQKIPGFSYSLEDSLLIGYFELEGKNGWIISGSIHDCYVVSLYFHICQAKRECEYIRVV